MRRFLRAPVAAEFALLQTAEKEMRVGPMRVSLTLPAMVLPIMDKLVAAEETEMSQTISHAGSQPSTKGPAEYFTGNVRIDRLFSPDKAISISGTYVTFEPGARSAWHTHPAGQRLVVTAGVGWTQEWGGPVVEIRPGDVISCPPGVKHWHGASPTTGMTHLAITGIVDGKNVEWMEKVTDEQYRK